MAGRNILVVGGALADIPAALEQLRGWFTQEAPTSAQALAGYNKRRIAAVIATDSLPSPGWSDFLERLKAQDHDALLILIDHSPAPDRARSIRAAFREGAFDVLHRDDILADPPLLAQSIEAALQRREFQELRFGLETELMNLNQNVLLQNKTLLDQADALQIEKIKLETRNRQLGDLTTSMDEVIAVCSHDLRSPLSTIKSIGQYLQQSADGKLDLVQKDFLQRLLKNADYALELIERLLDTYAKPKPKETHFDWVNINTIFNSIIQTFMFQIRQRDISLLYFNEWQELEFFGDRLKLMQLLNNLMVNAIKFTDKRGTIKVDVRKTGTAKGEIVEISVFNSGSFIPTADRSKIFQRFEQLPTTDFSGNDAKQPLETAPPSGKSQDKGWGLGLSICQEVCTEHGGEISVESEEDEGTTFTVRLPLLHQRENTTGAILPMQQESRGASDLVLIGMDDRFKTELRRVVPPEMRLLSFNRMAKNLRDVIEHHNSTIIVDEHGLAHTSANGLRTTALTSANNSKTFLFIPAHGEAALERYASYIDDVLSEPQNAGYLRFKLFSEFAWHKQPTSGPAVLIVDPATAFHEALHKEQRDFSLYSALNAYDALFIMRKRKIDVLVSEVRLAQLDGIELLTRVKRAYPHVWVCLYSRSESREQMEALSYFGADDVVSVSDNPAIMATCMHELLTKSRFRDQMKPTLDAKVSATAS